MSLRIATAPVSFGVYGEGGRRSVMPTALLKSAAAAGYSGMELGPPGFFGTPAETSAAFAGHGLTTAGAYVPVHFSADRETLQADLDAMRRTLEELRAFDTAPGLAILADEGSPELLLNPARDPRDRRLALDDEGWARLADGVAEALGLAQDAGVPTSFHPHIGTYVESPWEIERLLETTTVNLTLDTGHFRLAGADPKESLLRYGDRVNHVHLKDVRVGVLERAKAEQRRDFDVWWGDVATTLGDGDVELVGFLGQLLAQGYEGWLVVEQDRLPLGSESIEPVAAEQERNRLWVEAKLDALSTTTTNTG